MTSESGGRYRYTYYDNSRGHMVVFETIADCILKADVIYKQATGNDVIKQPHIGCTVTKCEEVQ